MFKTQSKLSFILNGEQVKLIKSIIPKFKSPFPVSANGLFQVKNDRLHFIFTDLKHWLKIRLNDSLVNWDNDQQLLFPLTAFKSLKSVKKNDVFQVVVNDNRIGFINNGIKQYFSIPQGEYPDYPIVNNEIEITANKRYIESLIAAKLFTTNNNREVLQYVCHRQGNIYATDSYRLFKKDNVYDNKFEKDVLVHKETIDIFKKVFVKESEIKMYIDDENIVYRSSNIELVASLGYQNYPDIQRVIPDNFNGEFSLNKNLLIPVLEQIIKQVRIKNNTTMFKLNFNELIVNARNKENDTSIEIIIPVDNVNGQNEIIIHANAQYVLDALKSIKDDFVTFKFNEPLKPFAIEANDDYHLIVPIRV